MGLGLPFGAGGGGGAQNAQRTTIHGVSFWGYKNIILLSIKLHICEYVYFVALTPKP